MGLGGGYSTLVVRNVFRHFIAESKRWAIPLMVYGDI